MQAQKITIEEVKKLLDETYSTVMEEIERLEPLTPYKSVEEKIIEEFRECFRKELEYKFENILVKFEEDQELTREDIEDLIDEAIDETDKYCTELSGEGFEDYLESIEDEKERERLEKEYEEYVEYVIKHNLPL